MKQMKQTKQLKILVKDVYGRRVFYPQCDQSKVFAAIAGTTTLTERTLRQITQLEYDIEFMVEPIKLEEIKL